MGSTVGQAAAEVRAALSRRVLRLRHRGHAVQCPCCERSWGSFAPDWNRPNAICPGCGSHERHRALCLYLVEHTPLGHEPMSLLHFAPEYALRGRMEAVPGLRYVTADLEPEGVDVQLDITAMPFDDGTFDAILCSHVLEHVIDDRAAMSELHRVLRPGGWALVRRGAGNRQPEGLPHGGADRGALAGRRLARSRRRCATAWRFGPERGRAPLTARVHVRSRPGPRWQEAGITRGPSTIHALTGGPLLERHSELAVLGMAADAAVAGAGSLALIEANAGLGKSRLLTAGIESARASGLRVLSAAGNELEGEFSFGLVLQLLEHELPDGTERDQLFQGAAGLARPLLERGDTTPGDGGEFPLLHGLYWLVSNLAERGPLLVAVDDLHWSDRPSMRFLLYLAQRLEGLPVMLAVALRPHEVSAADDVLAALRACHGATAIWPPPLGPDGVKGLVRARFPVAAPEFIRACGELTDGNPFLLTELLKGAQERGEEPSAATGAHLAQLAPDSVLRSVVARVQRVAPGASDLARAVAILGPHAQLSTATTLSGLDREPARQAADALAESEVLRVGDPLAFVHPLLRETIYGDVPEAERGAAHARAARLLAAEGAEPDAVAAHLLLAERAGDDWTVDALERAATLALGDGAPESAVTYLRRALAEPPEEARRPEVLLGLGRAEAALGEPTAADRLAQAVALTPGAIERGRATLDLAQSLHSLGRYVDAADTIDRALADLDNADEGVVRELEATWVSLARLAPPLRDEAVRRLAAIVERPPGDSHAERLLLAQASGQMVFAGEPREEACAVAGLALADGKLLYEGGPDDQGFLIALATFAWSDDFETCDRGMDEALRHARERGLPRRAATAIYGRSLTRHYAGRLVEAVADNEQAISAYQTGWSEYLPAACAQLSWAMLELDDIEAAERALTTEGLADVDSVSQVMVLEAKARVHISRGRTDTALATAEEAGRLMVASHVLNPTLLPWRSTAALAAMHQGDTGRARELVEEELRLAERFGAPRAIGMALRVRGIVEGGATGLEMLREAVSILAESPAVLEHARAMVDLGAALRRGGSNAEAREQLREALTLADRLGLIAIGRRAYDELQAAGARPRRRQLVGAHSLTPSERRVAGMAAEGMTNREIAQALFVTAKAVQWHLGNTYRKLEIAGRDELPFVLDGDPAG